MNSIAQKNTRNFICAILAFAAVTGCSTSPATNNPQPPPSNGGFTGLGQALNANPYSGGNPPKVALRVDANGDPVAAYFEPNSFSFTVKRWTANGWQPLGAPQPAANNALPGMALNSAGNPVVSWAQQAGAGQTELVVKQFTGSTWQQVGGALSSSAYAPTFLSTLEIDAAGNPVVAWIEASSTGTPNVYAKRFTGGSWQSFGSGTVNSQPTPTPNRPVMTFDSSANPTVAWTEYGSQGATYPVVARQWTGSAWQQASGANGNASTFVPALALDPSGRPLIALTQQSGGSAQVNVLRWENNAWQALGASLNVNPNRDASSPAITTDSNGNPVVAWSENSTDSLIANIQVKRWDGNTWTSVGSGAFNIDSKQSAGEATLALGLNGIVVVAWKETLAANSNFSNLYVKRLRP